MAEGNVEKQQETPKWKKGYYLETSTDMDK